MSLLKLTMCRGLPASGKSTWAAEEKARLETNHVECIIVNKDDIRNDLKAHGWEWSHKNEKDVIKCRDRAIRDALRLGVSVISSDCNFGKHKDQLKQLAAEFNAEFEVKDFTNVSVDECVQRDQLRKDKVGEAVIKEMYAKYVALPESVPYAPDPTKPTAIICDLDGTLALFKGIRSPFDYAKVAKDKVNAPVASIVKLFAENGYTIVYCSGREDWCRMHTEDFLKKNGLPDGPLFMRPTGDHRKDFLVKLDLFNWYIRDNYNIKFVLDDRDQVVKMWRKLGLTCLQVDYGDF